MDRMDNQSYRAIGKTVGFARGMELICIKAEEERPDPGPCKSQCQALC